MRISEPIKQSGYFWLPESPDQRLPGVLSISALGETILEVIGVFGDPVAVINATTLSLGRVVGVIENGDAVTLDHCFYQHRNVRLFGGLSKSTVYANRAFFGVQYDEGEIITFSKFCFSLEGLDEWLSLSGFEISQDLDARKTSIHYTAPKEIEFSLPDGIALAFAFSYSLPTLPATTEAKITQNAHITLKSDYPRPLEEFLALVNKLNDFLCFATDATVALDSAAGFSPDITREGGSGVQVPIPVNVYYKSTRLSDVPPRVDWHRMLFRYEQIGDQCENLVNKWLSNYEVSEPAFNLYFASKTGAHKYLEGRFLSLAQGIETLHRRNARETVMAEEDFRGLIEAVVNGCPHEQQKWLKEKLRYANELSLRRRLKRMLEPFETLYGDPKQRKQFVAEVVATRNYLTHYDPDLSDQAAKGKSLWRLCMKLEALFQLHFLRLMGLGDDSIKSLVEKNYALLNKLSN